MAKFNSGCILSPRDKRDLKFETLVAKSDIIKLPKYVFNPTVISFQDGVGACTGYSTATLKAGLEYKETGKMEKQSGHWVYAFNKMYDGIPMEGSTSRQGMKTLFNVGVPKETLCPNEPFTKWEYYKSDEGFTAEALSDADYKKIEGYSNVGKDLLLDALNKYGFVTMSVPWYTGDHNPQNYLMTGAGELVGYHSIACAGYISGKTINDTTSLLTGLINAKERQISQSTIGSDDQIWLIMANSFAEGWGYRGFALMPFNHEINEIWTVVSDLPNDFKNPPSSPSIRYGKQRTWKTFLYEQQTAFNPWLIKKIGRLPTNLEICKLAYGNWDWFSVYEKTRLEYGYTNWITKDSWSQVKSLATGNVGSDIISWRNNHKI